MGYPGQGSNLPAAVGIFTFLFIFHGPGAGPWGRDSRRSLGWRWEGREPPRETARLSHAEMRRQGGDTQPEARKIEIPPTALSGDKQSVAALRLHARQHLLASIFGLPEW